VVYLDWLFCEAPDTDEDEEYERSASVPAAMKEGFGNMFKASGGSWRCESCLLVTNPDSKSQCLAFETARPGDVGAKYDGATGSPDSVMPVTGCW
jgi:hypothetical protein